MDQRNWLGDDRLRDRILYTTKGHSVCIYCGEQASSKEHVPSKVFLRKPYPENLSIVPSCLRCNNGFSRDEVFLHILVEKLKKSYYGDTYEYDSAVIRRMDKYLAMANEVEELISSMQRGTSLSPEALHPANNRVRTVIEKLAIGHAVYELSIGYKSDSWTGRCNSISFDFKFNLSEDFIVEFDAAFALNNYHLPEIGSRVYDHIYIIELITEQHKIPVILLDWVNVQDGTYRYMSYISEDKIIVKLVIGEFLYASVTFKEEPH